MKNRRNPSITGCRRINMGYRIKASLIAITATLSVINVMSESVGVRSQLGILSENTLSGNNPATGAPWAGGDTYRFAFLSSTNTYATSADISTYNTFVQNLADNSTNYNIGADNDVIWKVIGSTGVVDARDNTLTNTNLNGTGESVFLLDGSTLIAKDYADLWDGNILHIINQTEEGVEKVHWPFTGSYWDGTKAPGHDTSFGALGDVVPGTEIHQGRSDVTNEWIWRAWTGDPANTKLPVYALTDPLVIEASIGTQILLR